MTILLLFVAFFLGYVIGRLMKSEHEKDAAAKWKSERAKMIATINTQADEIRHQEKALVELRAKKVNFEMECE